jgi:hypothetical protein
MGRSAGLREASTLGGREISGREIYMRDRVVRVSDEVGTGRGVLKARRGCASSGADLGRIGCGQATPHEGCGESGMGQRWRGSSIGGFGLDGYSRWPGDIGDIYENQRVRVSGEVGLGPGGG